jgi:hypothetical protein
MNIETKYNFGDFVVPIWVRREKIKVPTNCPACNDKGKVVLNDKEYTCPECRGYTYHTEDGDIEWYVIEDSVGYIGKIDIEFYDNQYIELENRKSEIVYMLDSTGVGSGTMWREDCLLTSIEEAQKECNRRNELKIGV